MEALSGNYEQLQREIVQAVVSMPLPMFQNKYSAILTTISNQNQEQQQWVNTLNLFIKDSRDSTLLTHPDSQNTNPNSQNTHSNVIVKHSNDAISSIIPIPSTLLFFGPINCGSSCYMDSVLVALFIPYHGGYFNNFLSTFIGNVDTGITRWEVEQCVTTEWRNTVQSALRDEARNLRDVTRKNVWRLETFRQHFAACKFAVANEWGAMKPVDFSKNQQQSAVDFIRYLFHILGVRNNICVYQQSTTLFDKRPEFTQNTTLVDLCNAWETASLVKSVTYTPETAYMMHDVDEARALQNAPSGTLYKINSAGDRMRISANETTAVMLCQMTGADLYTQSVSLTRDIVPNIEIIQTDLSYSGTLFAKMHSTHIDTEQTRVLLFEVSRNLGTVKVETPVDFGEKRGNSWILYVHSRMFKLSAVVCHRGTPTVGHYVSFVSVPLEDASGEDGGDEWCFYDDTNGHGLVITQENMMCHPYAPSQYGELFIYTLVPLG